MGLQVHTGGDTVPVLADLCPGWEDEPWTVCIQDGMSESPGRGQGGVREGSGRCGRSQAAEIPSSWGMGERVSMEDFWEEKAFEFDFEEGRGF